MVIDFHVHTFPDKLAAKTIPMLAGIAKSPYYADGTVSDTMKKMDEWNVDAVVMMHIATRPSSQTKVNDFAASIQNDRIFCFGSIHPDAEDAIDELDRIKNLGLKGVKLHPDYEGFMMDDPKMFPIYDAISQLNLPVLFHTGYDPYSPDVVHAPPKAVAKVAQEFPKMTIIAAHLGGMAQCDDSEEYLIGKNVYIDTAMASNFCTPEQMQRMIKKHGADKVLFATDCPWSTPEKEMAILNELKLSDEEKRMICSENAKKLLGF